jgi:hypothetical protein
MLQNGGEVRGADLTLVPLELLGPLSRDRELAAEPAVRAFGDPARLFSVRGEDDNGSGGCVVLDSNAGPEPHVLQLRGALDSMLRDEHDGSFEEYIDRRRA